MERRDYVAGLHSLSAMFLVVVCAAIAYQRGMTLSTAPVSANTIFYATLLFIFLTAIVGTLVSAWKRDACLKLFRGFHVTLMRPKGRTVWGDLRVLSSGLEWVFDRPVIDAEGRTRRSYMLYGSEYDTEIALLLRYHDELHAEGQRRRSEQAEKTFNPGLLRRSWRWVRNLFNTLRDAFNQAISVAIGRIAKARGGVAEQEQAGATQIGQSLFGAVAPNAYEPLLEQYIGQPVILDVPDPADPANRMLQFTGYLADYTAQFIAVFNVEHGADETFEFRVPTDLQTQTPDQISTLGTEFGLEVRVEGRRLKVINRKATETVAFRCLERDGFEPMNLGVTLSPNAILDFPLRDLAGALLKADVVRRMDIVAPRKVAVVRHAGECLEHRGLLDSLGLDELPLIPKGREKGDEMRRLQKQC